jgi:hypothetical protein
MNALHRFMRILPPSLLARCCLGSATDSVDQSDKSVAGRHYANQSRSRSHELFQSLTPEGASVLTRTSEQLQTQSASDGLHDIASASSSICGGEGSVSRTSAANGLSLRGRDGTGRLNCCETFRDRCGSCQTCQRKISVRMDRNPQ